jgi:translation initiation factor 3 subunit J
LVEKANAEKLEAVTLKTKGNALVMKREAEAQRAVELEIAKKAMDLETEMEENMTVDERKALERKRIEDSDFEAASDLFGGVDSGVGMGNGKVAAVVTASADGAIKLDNLKDYLKHAKKLSAAMKKGNKCAFSQALLNDLLKDVKDVLDTEAITDLIKTLNVINNDKLAADKRKSKGDAAKPKKDKAAIAKAKKVAIALYGDNDNYDALDQRGAEYEDNFF